MSLLPTCILCDKQIFRPIANIKLWIVQLWRTWATTNEVKAILLCRGCYKREMSE